MKVTFVIFENLCLPIIVLVSSHDRQNFENESSLNPGNSTLTVPLIDTTFTGFIEV